MFEGKVALVTGGASGIGQAAALKFADEGASVVIADIDEMGGEATVAAIEAAEGHALFVRADLRRVEDARAMVDATIDRFGRLDAALNNAAVPGPKNTAMTCEEADWDSVNDLNYKGVWLSMKFEIPAMLASGGGAIVNTSSGSGVRGRRGMVSYVASKHGLIGLTKSAAMDFAHRNIRVNTLLPGPTLTRMMQESQDAAAIDAFAAAVPMRRLGRPAEQAEAIVWLCSEKASFVTGASLAVDGGHQL